MSVDILSTATELYENSISEKASNRWMTLNVTRPPTSSSPCLWNQLPSSLRQPHSSTVSDLPVHAPTTSKSNSVNSPLSPSITPSLFHSRLETYLFHKSFPPQTHFRPQDWFRGLYSMTRTFLLSISVFVFFVTLFCLVPCGRLSSFWAHVNIVHRIVSSSEIKRFDNPYVTSYHWSVVTLSLPCNTWPFPRYCHFFIVRDCLWSCEVRQFWDHIRFQIHT